MRMVGEGKATIVNRWYGLASPQVEDQQEADKGLPSADFGGVLGFRMGPD